MKKLLPRRALCVILIFTAVFAVYGLGLLINGSTNALYVNFDASKTYEKTEVKYGENYDRTESDLLEMTKLSVKNGYVKAVFKAKAKGSEPVMLLVHTTGEGGNTRNASFEVMNIGAFRIILNNIYQHISLVLTAAVFFIALYYVYCLRKTVRTKRFSYDSVFCLSVVLLLFFMAAVWSAASVFSYIRYHTTASDIIYTVNRNLMTAIIAATVPLTAIYVLSVSVSNLALMKKEGFRPTNALGLITSAVMLAGLGVIAFLCLNGQVQSTALNVANSVISSLYVLFETVLISMIIYGIYVSKYTPAYNKDYIIILGCMIKEDGTLYPLVRGRADKAIEFYKKQLEKTGKAACFIPSGGKGSDEIMPEAEAIKNYLLSQGIPEEHIIAETKSTTTRENMKFSKEIIDREKPDAEVIFSTTSYHVFRSGAIAYDNGINIDGIGSKTKWYFWPNAFLREVAGIFVSQPKKQLIIIALIALSAGLGSFLYSMIK